LKKGTRKREGSSAGGKAEASGSQYESSVAAWYSVAIALGRANPPPVDLPVSVHLINLYCQSDAPVDDVNIETSDGGTVFVQAKRTVHLSDSKKSAFAQALDQFVRQYKVCEEKGSKSSWCRPLEAGRDRLVLATRSTGSSKVTQVLPRLLRGLRDVADIRSLNKVATSKGELEIARTTEKVLKRSWRAAYGQSASPEQLDRLLRLIWIQALDVESGERDRAAALASLRTSLLEDPSTADLAYGELFKLTARLRADRSGTDRPTLVRVLSDAGIVLSALPDYRADINALKKWTLARLQRAPRFTQLLDSNPGLTIERAIWPLFASAALQQSMLVVGDPGAGKSGLTYRLAASAAKDNADVVLLPVDLLSAESFASFRDELGITHDLTEVLANWPRSRPGIIIIDALDAARKSRTQTILREVVDAIVKTPGNRWCVLASVRKYDLRQGMEWARIFRGDPPIPSASDPEFARVRHVSVKPLTDEEISQIATALPALLAVFSGASEDLQKLLRNIFNLHLLADLLESGVLPSAVSEARTQAELLAIYWRYRIRRDDGEHGPRENALKVVISHMIDARSLQVSRSVVQSGADSRSIVDLERNDILRAEDQDGRPTDTLLLFSHHVMFDYAVARLTFELGGNPAQLVQLLKAKRELALMLGPSLTLALNHAWGIGGTRQAFWNLAFALAQEPGLPGLAQLAAPMVAAESAANSNDFAPAIAALTGLDSNRSAAEAFFSNLIGAIFVRRQAGVPLIGPTAGPWMELAYRLAQTGNERMMFAVRPLIQLATSLI
jgi:hypothetical protein